LLRDARHRHSAEWVVGKLELALQPGTEGPESANPPGDAARGKRPVVTCVDLDKPAADDRRTQLCERRPIAGALEEA
jgi:hypothetical protein